MSTTFADPICQVEGCANPTANYVNLAIAAASSVPSSFEARCEQHGGKPMTFGTFSTAEPQPAPRSVPSRPCYCNRCLPEGGSLQAELETVVEERNRLIDAVRAQRAQNAALRTALATIAEQARAWEDSSDPWQAIAQIETCASRALEGK